eukprot:gnl/MRDRNA2_/MRDRNA2_101379_c0_seq1.p1 gnl/MRDRNA2_/MRDRNA2_101379_c0~~gnl/MRDRNA2_/MRDRNA2_101379_c0_seq1.p1  ORF type:complete len:154 (+),score=36.46 gnl/MRDRNA2_/MRDRNA2_101379_c0_seq1:123-584(+)
MSSTKPVQSVAKVNSFAALDAETSATETPDGSVWGDSDSDETSVVSGQPIQDTIDGDDWLMAPQRRKQRVPQSKLQAPAQTLPASPSGNGSFPAFSPEPDSDWFLRKGQRHNHRKVHKESRNFKDRQRVALAKQKRVQQRELCMAFEDDESES